MAQKIKKTINGVKVKVSSYKINLLAYKEIAGRVVIRATKKKIDRKNVKVTVANHYFALNPHPLPQIPVMIGNPIEKTRIEKKYTTVRHFAVGIGVKITGTSISPSLPGNLVNLPISGVITKATITVDGKTEVVTTQKGKVGVI